MKTALLLLVAALAMHNGASATRDLKQQLPVLGSPAVGSVAAAPGPGLDGCALRALQESGNFTTLLGLIQQSSQASQLQSLLSSNSQLSTVFAPTNAGIAATLAQKGISASSLTPAMLTTIIQYHVLPSQLQTRDLQNGFSFNTLSSTNGAVSSVAVQGNGLTSTIVGKGSSAPIISTLTACQFVVYPIDGLLLPN